MKYRYQFKSQNDESQWFVLTFEVEPARRIHVVTNVQVYQVSNDTFCAVNDHASNNRHSLKVLSITDAFKFHIDIYIRPGGCEIFIIETVLTTIAHEDNLQPCNR